MYVKNELKSCSGCGLCAQVCTRKAIIMKAGEDGFVYPHIDETLCTDCGACRKICPFDSSYVSEKRILASYAVKHEDDVRRQSSSGGFFSILSDYILENGGVVYGAVWTEKFAVKHIRADQVAQRDQMRSSKYLQSQIYEIYEPLKKDVVAGKLVLFTGTPCQCAAISRLFGKTKPENLWIMDLICHGVLPQSFFDAYLKDIQDKYPSKTIKKVNLRDKRYGLQAVGIEMSDGTVYHSEDDYFYKAYAFRALQRESCFSCTCTKETRFGDFTVGDFWGSKQNASEFHDELGISLVLVNTEKAKALYQILCEHMNHIPVPSDAYVPYQPNLRAPTVRVGRADSFLMYYRKHGYKKTMHRFFDVTLIRRINSFGYKTLRKIFRKWRCGNG